VPRVSRKVEASSETILVLIGLRKREGCPAKREEMGEEAFLSNKSRVAILSIRPWRAGTVNTPFCPDTSAKK
jgi:hypothetical protein